MLVTRAARVFWFR